MWFNKRRKRRKFYKEFMKVNTRAHACEWNGCNSVAEIALETGPKDRGYCKEHYEQKKKRY